MERQEAPGHANHAHGNSCGRICPFYGLVSRITETLQEVGRGVPGISALFPYESKDVRLGGHRAHWGNSSTRILPLPGICYTHYVSVKAALELSSYNRSSKGEALVYLQLSILGYQRGLRGHSSKGGIVVISAADILDSVIIDYLCKYGQVTLPLCFLICNMGWGR